MHIGFPDPAKVEGTDEEKWRAFVQTRDAIRERVCGDLAGLE